MSYFGLVCASMILAAASACLCRLPSASAAVSPGDTK
jgi:hypothetical protein